MNAPAKIAAPITPDTGWTPAEIAHRRTISVHYPNGSEIEMMTRVQIAMLRDQATIGMSRASDSAAVILGEVSRLATHAVLAAMPTSELMRIRSALSFTMEAARSIERVTRNG